VSDAPADFALAARKSPANFFRPLWNGPVVAALPNTHARIAWYDLLALSAGAANSNKPKLCRSRDRRRGWLARSKG
jgi:hypothetical protein